MIAPSLSWTWDISTNSNEGYFVEELDNYLKVNAFNYTNVLREKSLSKSDYWSMKGMRVLLKMKKFPDSFLSCCRNTIYMWYRKPRHNVICFEFLYLCFCGNRCGMYIANQSERVFFVSICMNEFLSWYSREIMRPLRVRACR